jgi:hypothetical protein
VATCLAAAEDEPFERNAEERQHEIQYDSMGKYDGHKEGENKKKPLFNAFGTKKPNSP